MATPRDILGFQDRRSLLQQVLGRGGGGALTAGTVSFNASLQLGADAARAVGDSRSLLADVRRAMRNYGRLLVERARTLTRQKDTIRTRLLISSWSYELDDVTIAGISLPLRVSLTNSAPYARYVHPKGDRKRLIAHYMGPHSGWRRDRAQELAETIRMLKERIARQVANKALQDARKAARGRGAAGATSRRRARR